MRENYFDAAVRHYVDGCILFKEECYDNAVCLFGNSAECALKSLIESYLGESGRGILKHRYGHKGAVLINDLDIFIRNSSITLSLDPALGVKLLGYVLPEVLFEGHPERRYADNNSFQAEDVEICIKSADFLMREMIRQHIDGYI